MHDKIRENERPFAPMDTQQLRVDGFERLSRRGMLIAIGMHAIFGLFGLLFGAPLLTYLQVVSVAVYSICYALPFRRFQPLINALTILDLLGHSTLAAWIVGTESGFQYYSWILLPLTFTHIGFDQRSRLTRAVALCAAFILVDLWLRSTTPVVHVGTFGLAAMHYFNLICFFTAMTLSAVGYTQATANAEAKLRVAAGTDVLTGLLNRRRMTDQMQQVWAQTRADHRPLTVMLLDIDHFKMINDRFGHARGDEVIARVGDVLKRTVRRGDLVARWGGEEFLVVLPNASLAEAKEIAERMRFEIAGMVFGSDARIHASATVGVAAWREGESLDATIHRADTLLYSGKHMGRNRVVIQGTPPENVITHQLAS